MLSSKIKNLILEKDFLIILDQKEKGKFAVVF